MDNPEMDNREDHPIAQRLELVKASLSRRTKVKKNNVTSSFVEQYLSDYSSRSSSGRQVVADILQFALTLQDSDDPSALRVFLSQFEDHLYIKTISAICHGHGSGAEYHSGLHTIDKSAISVFLCDPAPDPKLRLLFERMAMEFGVRMPLELTDLNTLGDRIRKKQSQLHPRTYADAVAIIKRAHVYCWPILFSEVFRILVRMTKFDAPVTAAELRRTEDLSAFCGLDKLFSELLILRSLSGNEAELAYIQDRARRLRKMVGLPEPSSMAERELGTISTEPILRLIELVDHVHNSANESEFLNRLTECYELDEAVADFLNWERLMPLIEKTAGIISPKLVFMSTLASSERVSRKFPRLFVEYWHGGATADLEQYALHIRSREKNSGINDFFQSLTELPERSRERAFRHLFSPTVIERLATILTPPMEAKLTLTSGADEYKALFAQLAVLDFLDGKSIVDKPFIDQKRADVRNFLRHLVFSNHRTSGMIKIDPLDLSNEISRFLARDSDRYLRMLFGQNEYGGALNIAISSVLSKALMEYVYFNSRLAFDYVISNRLRHGWLERRLEKSVIDFYTRNMVPGFDRFSLMSDLGDLVAEFNANHLTVREQSKAFETTSGNLFEWFRHALAAGPDYFQSAALDSLPKMLIDSLSRFLEDARHAWVTEFRDRAFDLCSSAVESPQGLGTFPRDALHGLIAAAFEETALWIAVSKEDGDPTIDFHLRPLINFEIRTVSVGDSGSIKVNFEVYDDENGHRRCHGYDVSMARQYMAAMTALVDNLVQNAMQKSGLGARTEFNVIMSVSKRRIVFEFQNTFRRSELSRMRKHASAAATKIASADKLSDAELVQRRRLEGGRGMVKIMYECRTAFGRGAELSVDEGTLEHGWFTLRAVLPCTSVALVPPPPAGVGA